MRMCKRLLSTLALPVAFALSAATIPVARGQNQTQLQDPQQAPVIKVETALVTLPVIVTDRFGQFVTGLAQRDFTVREDGVRQEISSFSSTEAPFDVALLIDTSHSTQRKLGAIRKAALTFVKQLQPKDRVMIVTFDDKVSFVSDLTSDRTVLKRAIESVKSSFATSLYEAIVVTVNQKLAPLSSRKAIVVLTDGVDTASKTATYASTLDLISTAGVIAYAIQYETRNTGGPILKPMNLPGPIGALSTPPPAATQLHLSNSLLQRTENVGRRPADSRNTGGWYSNQTGRRAPEPPRDRYLIARDFLRALAVQSGARYHQAETIESTSYAFALIANELRHQYTIAYYSTNDKRDGELRSVKLGVQNTDLVVRTRTAFRAPRAPEESDGSTPPRRE